MSKFQFIKNIATRDIAFGFLVALVVLGSSLLLSSLLYQTKKENKRGFEVAVSQNGQKVVETAKPKVVDIKELVKTADFDAGAKIFKKCATCHSAEKNGGNKIGPNLFGVVNRKRAAIVGFTYSEAIKKKSGSWNYDDLNQFLTKPKDFIPGTKMGFAGLKKDKDRANVILYLEKSAK
jgi:cytochrome c